MPSPRAIDPFAGLSARPCIQLPTPAYKPAHSPTQRHGVAGAWGAKGKGVCKLDSRGSLYFLSPYLPTPLPAYLWQWR